MTCHLHLNDDGIGPLADRQGCIETVFYPPFTIEYILFRVEVSFVDGSHHGWRRTGLSITAATQVYTVIPGGRVMYKTSSFLLQLLWIDELPEPPPSRRFTWSLSSVTNACPLDQPSGSNGHDPIYPGEHRRRACPPHVKGTRSRPG